MALLTPIKSIREKCLECMCQQSQEVKCCTILDCSLWMYRFGKRPNPKNPYLAKHFFKGKENLTSTQLIKIINQNEGLSATKTGRVMADE